MAANPSQKRPAGLLLQKKKEGDHGFSRPPLERMMRLHAALKARRFPNCQKIGAELEVSAKTIQRDIDFMRYRLGSADRLSSAGVRLLLHRAGHGIPEHRSFRRGDRSPPRRAESAGPIRRNAFRAPAAERFPKTHERPERPRFVFLERSGGRDLVPKRGSEHCRYRAFRNREQRRLAVSGA